MTFKIVQTIEEDSIELSIIPTKWENGGVLNWPVKHSFAMDRLLRDGASEPPLTGCFQMECRVKRVGISSYKEASIILNKMKTVSDSEADEISRFRSKSNPNPKYTEYDTNDYNVSLI